MPAGDGTGPRGTGSRTGRGMGYCSGYEAPGWAHPGPGRQFFGRGGRGMGGGRWGGYGYGAGRGGGRRRGNWVPAAAPPRWPGWEAPPMAAQVGPYAAPSREQEMEMLKGEAEWLGEQLEAITRRMDELSEE